MVVLLNCVRGWRAVASASIAALLVIGTQTACGRNDPGLAPVAAVPGIDLTAELQPETGAVILPYDRLIPTAEEQEIISSAGSLALAQCAAKKGVKFRPAGPRYDPIYASEDYFGPWTKAQALRFGFATPSTDRDLAANGVEGGPAFTPRNPFTANDDLTDEDWAVVGACENEDAQSKMFTDDVAYAAGPWTEELSAAHTSMLDSDAAAVIMNNLAECYQAKGLTIIQEQLWTPKGVNARVISEDQIALALATIECKEQTKFTRRMADLEAAYQAPIIAKYAAELLAGRQKIESAFAKAREVIAAHSDLFAPEDD